MLVRLLYASRSVNPGSSELTESILAQSRTHNPAMGITGILCYGGGIFLQALEGGRMQISELYGHIQKDARHKDVVLLHYEEISERRFSGWTMGQVNVERRAQTLPQIEAVAIRSSSRACDTLPDTEYGSSSAFSEYFSRMDVLIRSTLTWPMVQPLKRRSLISS